jgi:hypothetical protein
MTKDLNYSSIEFVRGSMSKAPYDIVVVRDSLDQPEQKGWYFDFKKVITKAAVPRTVMFIQDDDILEDAIRALSGHARFLIHIEHAAFGTGRVVRITTVNLTSGELLAVDEVKGHKYTVLMTMGALFDWPWAIVTIVPSGIVGAIVNCEFEDAAPWLMPINGSMIPRLQKANYEAPLKRAVALCSDASRGMTPGGCAMDILAELQGDGPYFPDNALEPAEEAVIGVRIRNAGPGSATDIRLRWTCSNPEIKIEAPVQEFRIIPKDGEETINVTLKASRALLGDQADLEFIAEEGRGYNSPPFRLTVPVRVPAPPKLEFGVPTISDGGSGLADGNGDGVVQNGETIELTIPLTNIGKGPAFGLLPELRLDTAGATLTGRAPTIAQLIANDKVMLRYGIALDRRIQGTRLEWSLAVHEERLGGVEATRGPIDIQTAAEQLALIIKERPEKIRNGETGHIAFAVSNDGGLDAIECACTITADPGIEIDPAQIALGRIPEGATSPITSITVALSPSYDKSEATLVFSLSSEGNPRARKEEYIPAEIRRPELAISLLTSNGRPLELGRPGKLMAILTNQGTLMARDVVVTLEAERPYTTSNGTPQVYRFKKDYTVGNLEPESQWNQAFTLDPIPSALATESIEYRLNVTQQNFSSLRLNQPISVVGARATTGVVEPGAEIPEGFFERIGAYSVDSRGEAAPMPVIDDVDLPNPTIRSVYGPDDVAIVIGVRTYRNSRVPVEYAVRDAKAFKRYCEQTMGIAATRIICLNDAEATMDQIRIALRKVKQLIVPGKSRCIFFFSGHGSVGFNDHQSYILPFEADLDFIEDSALATKELYDMVADVGAASVWVFLDACFANQVFSNDGPPEPLVSDVSMVKMIDTRPGTVRMGINLFLATDEGQVAAWDKGSRHGVFTRCLLEALQGRADANHDRRITSWEMQDYLQTNVPKRAIENRNVVQTPYVLFRDAGETLISW